MRLFIAIQFSDDVRHALTDVQNRLRNNGVSGNYTKKENLHLTLAFIGDYPNPDFVLDVMDTVPFEPFPLTVSGFGTFHGILWAGISENEALKKYVKRLRRVLAENNIPFDRKNFSPHITLVRKPVWHHSLPDITMPEKQMLVERISLMRSDRGKNSMIYSELS